MSLEKLAKLVDTYSGLIAQAAMSLNEAVSTANEVIGHVQKVQGNPIAYDQSQIDELIRKGQEAAGVIKTFLFSNQGHPLQTTLSKLQQAIRTLQRIGEEKAGRAETGGTRRRTVSDQDKAILRNAALAAVGMKRFDNEEFKPDASYQNKWYVANFWIPEQYYKNIENFRSRAQQVLATIIRKDPGFPVGRVGFELTPATKQ